MVGASAGASGQVSVPFSSLGNFSLQGLQFTGSAYVTPLVGVGAFAGFGPGGSVGGAGGAAQGGVSNSSSTVMQFGVGDGGGVETSASFGDPSFGAAAGARGAIGAYGAVGESFSKNLTLGDGC